MRTFGLYPPDCHTQGPQSEASSAPKQPVVKGDGEQVKLNHGEFNSPVVNLEISVIRGKDIASDISNEHRTFSLQCGLLSILIVWVFISSLPPLFSATFPSGGFIPFDRLVKALLFFFFPNSRV